MNIPGAPDPLIVSVIPAHPPIRHHVDDLGDMTIIGWAIDVNGRAHPVYIPTHQPDFPFVDFKD